MRFLISLCILVLSFGCGKKQGSSGELTLYVAASLSDVIQEIGVRFEQRSGVDLIFNFASSGALAQQIIASPRADLYLSASEDWMDAVEKKGLLLQRKNILANTLVVVANADSILEFTNIESFPFLPFEHLCVGDPAFVPAGRYAMMWLSSIDSTVDGRSVWDAVKEKVSPSPDVRAAMIQVLGSTDALGIVYATDYASRSDELKLLYQVPNGKGPSVTYAAGFLKSSKNKQVALEFLEFMKSDEAIEVFRTHGFQIFDEQ